MKRYLVEQVDMINAVTIEPEQLAEFETLGSARDYVYSLIEETYPTFADMPEDAPFFMLLRVVDKQASKVLFFAYADESSSITVHTN
jgi:hypothetical protein